MKAIIFSWIIWLNVFVLPILNLVMGQSVVPAKTPAEQVASDGIGSQVQQYGGAGSFEVGAGGDLSLVVPVTTVPGRSLQFPLTLAYTAGIKVEQSASDVGLGWNISFGSISRDIGAFDPDYAVPGGTESREYNSMIGGGSPSGTGTPAGGLWDPTTQLSTMMFDGLLAGETMKDVYHVSIPGLGGGSFVNGGSTTYDWKWMNGENWKVAEQAGVIESHQEWSRVNEINFPAGYAGYTEPDFITGHGSFAAAIGIPDWTGPWADRYSSRGLMVADDGSRNFNLLLMDYPAYNKVRYKDLAVFTIVDDAGTTYVFGKPLKAQRYIFPEDPFYSTVTRRQADAAAGWSATHHLTVLGEAWKLEYIAEWLLTEIRSADYSDVNGNGIADDGDNGDWIRIEYAHDDGNPLTCTGVEAEKVPVPLTYDAENTYPYFREYVNFTQTDIASACWREIAYVSRIVSPTHILNVQTESRMEVEHDYYEKIANYAYRTDTWGWTIENHLKQYYPNRLQRYGSFTLYDRFPVGTPTQIKKVKLNYAAMGSPEQLAVSQYLIRENTDTEGSLLSALSPYRPAGQGRGKTTLLGVTVTAPGTSEAQTTSFEYGYNPDYTAVHRAMMWEELYFPTKRESYSRDDWENTTTDHWLFNTHYYPSIKPFQALDNLTYYNNNFHIGAAVSWPYLKDIDPLVGDVIAAPRPGIRKMMNETGYYYDPMRSDLGIGAWSLTKVKYPTGGSMEIVYEPDVADFSNRASWSLKDDELVNVQTSYNRVCATTSIHQGALNADPVHNSEKFIPDEYHLPLTTSGSGIRVQSVATDDGMGLVMKGMYEYGGGKLVRPGADYWGTFLQGFSKHLRVQKARMASEEFCVKIPGVPDAFFYNNFDRVEYSHASPCRIDLNLSDGLVYEWVKSVQADGSVVKTTYQTGTDVSYPDVCNVYPMKYTDQIVKNIFFIGASPLRGIGRELKVEYFRSGDLLPYMDVEYGYESGVTYTEDVWMMPHGTVSSALLAVQLFSRMPLFRPLDCTDIYTYYPWDAVLMGSSFVYEGSPGYSFFNRIQNGYTLRKSETGKLEGMVNTVHYEYEPTHRLPKRVTRENSRHSSGKREITVEEMTYAWEVFPTGSMEGNLLRSKNLISLPAKRIVYGLNSPAEPLSPARVLSAEALVYKLVPDAYLNAVKLHKRFVFNSNKLDAAEGWITDFVDFNFYGWSPGLTAVNAEGWTETEMVPTQWNETGGAVRYDTPYLTGQVVMGYMGSAPLAWFSNTNGLDASYNGFEDYQEDMVSGPVRQSEGWVFHTGNGNVDDTRAFTGMLAWYMDDDGETPHRVFNTVPLYSFPGNATEYVSGSAPYRSCVRVYAQDACTLRFHALSASDSVVLSKTISPADLNKWALVEWEFDVPAAWVDMDCYVSVSGAPGTDVWVDDLLVYPAQAEWSYRALNHLRLPVAVCGMNHEVTRAEYDPFGRLLRTYNADGHKTSEYSYKISADLTVAHHYVETAIFRSATKVGAGRVFLDGLGRTRQTMTWEPSAGRAIAESTVEYDFKGRPVRTYLPFPVKGLTTGLPVKMISKYAFQTGLFYGSDYPYSEVVYDATPENRVLHSYHPRMNWQKASGMHTDRKVNAVPEAGRLAGETLMATVTDEDGNMRMEVYDKAGKLLESQQPLTQDYVAKKLGGIALLPSGMTVAVTKYEYDRAGRLIRVTNPEGLVTAYAYNAAGAMLKESHPDRGVTEWLTDRYGRLKAWREPNDKADAVYPDPGAACSGGCGRFQWVVYDRAGRSVHEGVAHYNNPMLFEGRNGIAPGDVLNDKLFPMNLMGYGLPVKVHVSRVYSDLLPNARGRLREERVVHSHTWDAGTGNFLPGTPDVNRYVYDAMGRITKRTIQLSGLAGVHDLVYEYNFAGDVTRESYISSVLTVRTFKKWEHDDHGRVVKAMSGVDDMAAGLTKLYTDALYEYDDIGRLMTKGVGPSTPSTSSGSSSGGGYVDVLHYYHDIRGRLMKQEGLYLNFVLDYDNRGNILRNRWLNGAFDSDPKIWNQYEYTYDYAYRLTSADYSTIHYIASPLPPGGILKAGAPYGDSPPGTSIDGVAIYAARSDIDEPPVHDPMVDVRLRQMNEGRDVPELEQLYGTIHPGFEWVTQLDGTDYFAPKIFQDSLFLPADSFRFSGPSPSPSTPSTSSGSSSGGGSGGGAGTSSGGGDIEYAVLIYAPDSATAVLRAAAVPASEATLKGVEVMTAGCVYKAIYAGSAGSGPATYAVTVPESKYDAWFWYDAAGNHERLMRRLWVAPAGGSPALHTQDMYYSYLPGNSKLHKAETPAWTMAPAVYNSTFSYDPNGNLLTDAEAGIDATRYDWRNRAVYMRTHVPDDPAKMSDCRYRYDAAGMRIYREVTDLVTGGVLKEFFIGGLVLNEAGALVRVPVSEGYARLAPGGGLKRFYEVKDWLGTPRVVLDASAPSTALIVIGASDNYPYGLPLGLRTMVADPEGGRYVFTGHERDGENGLDYHGARYYNPVTGRYCGVDIMRGSYPEWGSYVYCVGNPVNYVDPLGMWPWGWRKNAEKYAERTGQTLSWAYHNKAGLGLVALVGDADNPLNTFVFHRGNGHDYLFKRGQKAWHQMDSWSMGQRFGHWLEGIFGHSGGGDFGPNKSSVIGMVGQDMGHVVYTANLVGYLSEWITGEEGPQPATEFGRVAGWGVLVLEGAGAAVALAKLGKAAGRGASRIFEVGAYKDIKGVEAGLDAHHVGQSAVMKRLIPNYDRLNAPAILVPREGHTLGSGVLARSTTGIDNARDLIARDIRELRRVYPNVPNSSLEQLIQMNKTMYPDAFIKKPQ